MNLQNLNWSFHVLLPQLIRPSVDIPNVPHLTGDAHPVPEPNPHAPISESLQGILLRPPLLADEIRCRDSPTAALASFAVYNGNSPLCLRARARACVLLSVAVFGV